MPALGKRLQIGWQPWAGLMMVAIYHRRQSLVHPSTINLAQPMPSPCPAHAHATCKHRRSSRRRQDSHEMRKKYGFPRRFTETPMPGVWGQPESSACGQPPLQLVVGTRGSKTEQGTVRGRVAFGGSIRSCSEPSTCCTLCVEFRHLPSNSNCRRGRRERFPSMNDSDLGKQPNNLEACTFSFYRCRMLI